MTGLRAACAAALLSVSITGVAQAASPPIKGARYIGVTSQQQPVDGRVTSTGEGLQLSFAEVLRCSDRTRMKLSSRYVEQRPTIKADGTFDYGKAYTGRAGFPGFRGTHDETQQLTGQFSQAGRVLSVRSKAVLSRPGRSCHSTITIKARLRR
jgi:hypothetical protein